MDSRIDWDLKEMLELWLAGWSYSDLGKRYGRDHSTIMHHIQKKFPVEYENRKVNRVALPYRGKRVSADERRKRILERKDVAPQYAHLMRYDDDINEGKSYTEYLKEALKRPAERHYDRLVGDAFHAVGKEFRYRGITKHLVDDEEVS